MEEQVLGFKSGAEWERWLSRNHSRSSGIWMRMFRKHYTAKFIKGAEALDVALCYGWITGQARPYDKDSCLWRFCPRRPRSIWSKVNTAHAERLIREGRMKPSGLRQIEEAKADGRWARAYSPPSTAVLPKDFITAVGRNKKAKEFLKTLNRSNRYSIIFRIENAKSPEKRREKIRSIVKMLGEGKAFH